MSATPHFVELWRFQGLTENREISTASAVDSEDNLVIVGYMFSPTDIDTEDQPTDIGAVKLDGSTGDFLWTWSAASPDSDAFDYMFGIATDSSDDVFMGGYSEGFWAEANTDGRRDIAAVKLDGATGDELWRYQAVAGDSETSLGGYTWYGQSSVADVAVDGDDNVFLVGYSFNSFVAGAGDPGDVDLVVIKLDGASGEELWRVQGGGSTGWERLLAARVDAAGDLVAAGAIVEKEDRGGDFLIMKLSGEDGDSIWSKTRTTTTMDLLNGIDVDQAGNVYVAGGEEIVDVDDQLSNTAVVMKLDGETGDALWGYSGALAFDSRTEFQSVSTDPTTSLIVAAGTTVGNYVTGSAEGYDFAAVVLDSDTGDELATYQDGTSSTDGLFGAKFDSNGNLFLTGFSYGEWTAHIGEGDFAAVKFSPLLDAVPTPAPTVAVPTPAPRAVGSSPMEASPIEASPIEARAPVSFTPTPSPASGSDGFRSLATWQLATFSAAGLGVVLVCTLFACFLRKRKRRDTATANVASTASTGTANGSTSKDGAVGPSAPPNHESPRFPMDGAPPTYDSLVCQGNESDAPYDPPLQGTGDEFSPFSGDMPPPEYIPPSASSLSWQ